MLKNLLEYYMILSTMYSSIILVALLLGIDIEIKPFKYSLKKLLERYKKVQWVEGKPIPIKCNKCNNDVIPYEYYLGIPYYKCDKCEYQFPYDANIDNSFNNLEKALNKLYDDCRFEILIISEDDIEIMYNNRKYMNNNDFIDNVFKIASMYIDKENLWKLTIIYDVLGEMN